MRVQRCWPRSFYFVLSAGLVSTYTYADNKSPNWTAKVADKAGFQANFPKAPTEIPGEQKTEVGVIKNVTYESLVSNDLVFNVVWSTFPEQTAKSWIPANVLEGAQAGS